jgi:hypothetical protein
VRRPLYLLPVAALLGLSALPLPTAAALTTGTLPGGTAISVSIDNPPDGALLPPGPVAVSGTASIGTTAVLANTALVYVLDLSGSTRDPAGDCDKDGSGDTVIKCEIAAAKAVNQQAIAQKNVGEVGMVGFASSAKTGQVNKDNSAIHVTGPATDSDNDQIPDIEFVLAHANVGSLDQYPPSQSVSTQTNFAAAVAETTTLVRTLSKPNKIVLFMSDGVATEGDPVAANVADLHATGAQVFTFAVGANSSCTTDTDPNTNIFHGSLADIAGNGGSCKPVVDVTKLPEVLPAVITAQLTDLSLLVDTDSPVKINVPSLPVDGGKPPVTYNATTKPLDPGPHTICVQADGHDSGKENNGNGHVTECHTIHINEPPVVSAGGPYSGPEDNPIAINGTVSDPDGPLPTTISWSILAGNDVKTPFSCTFGDIGAVSTTVNCSEHGTYTLTLTASDGLHTPVSSSTRLTVINQAPKVSAGGPYSGNEDNAVPIAGTVTDPDGPSLTTRWSIEAGTDVPTPFNCTFGDAAALSTTVTCDQHGTYRLTLTANDSVNAPVSASAEVTFINVPPTVSAGGPYKGNQGNQVPIVGTATDPDGPPLTSIWTIEPVNDGSVPEGSVCTFANPNALSTTVSCTERGN